MISDRGHDVLKLCLPNTSILFFFTHFEVSSKRLDVKRWGLQLGRELVAYALSEDVCNCLQRDVPK